MYSIAFEILNFYGYQSWFVGMRFLVFMRASWRSVSVCLSIDRSTSIHGVFPLISYSLSMENLQ
jgi:hypothetical protein